MRDDKRVIDLASSGPFRVTAGQGKNQSFDFSQLKQVAFAFTQGQKLQIGVEKISDFHGGDGYTIQLIFQDSENHIVEVNIGDSEKAETIFENAGTYHLTIQNDEDTSLHYSFVL